MPLDPTFLRGVRALTFDCYGALIDWDGGIAAALASLPSLAGPVPDMAAAARLLLA